MKELRIMLEDWEYKKAVENKRNRTWKQVFLDGVEIEDERRKNIDKLPWAGDYDEDGYPI